MLWILIQREGHLLSPPIWPVWSVYKLLDRSSFLSAFLLKAKFQSQSWLWASEKPVHEGHGRSTVSPEPAHQNTQEVRGGCKRGWLLPVSISLATVHVMVTYLIFTCTLMYLNAVLLVVAICKYEQVPLHADVVSNHLLLDYCCYFIALFYWICNKCRHGVAINLIERMSLGATQAFTVERHLGILKKDMHSFKVLKVEAFMSLSHSA